MEEEGEGVVCCINIDIHFARIGIGNQLILGIEIGIDIVIALYSNS